jgi:hypothetical protein
LATRVFADQELEALRKFPKIGRDELFRFFTLTLVDVAFIDPGRGPGTCGPARAGHHLVHAAVAGIRAGRRNGRAVGGGGAVGCSASISSPRLPPEGPPGPPLDLPVHLHDKQIVQLVALTS